MSKTIAYFDCFSGISGDMAAASLLDAGVDSRYLTETLSLLRLPGYTIDIVPDERSGIGCTRFVVQCEGNQPHRGLAAIRAILEQSLLPPDIREKALAVFTALAQAEARVHRVSVDQVHFHEVGAVDAMVDVVAVAAGLAFFKVDEIMTSPLPLGRGEVRCAHGTLPLPTPAVTELVKGLAIHGAECDQELVTPTGAAILRGLGAGSGSLPPMTITHVGYGAGSRESSCGRPNLLRVVIGRRLDAVEAQEVEVIETHLDDWSPEVWPYLCQKLLDLGALDAALIPIQMKKGRPGFLIRVVAERTRSLALKQCILSETSAIGLRFRTEQRLTLPRNLGRVETPWGEIAAKRIETPAGVVLTGEFESCRKAAQQHGVPVQRILQHVAALDPSLFREHRKPGQEEG